MARYTDAELEEIVQTKLPGYRIVRTDDEATAADATRSAHASDEIPTARTPDLDALRERYLGGAARQSAREEGDTFGTGSDEGAERVVVAETALADEGLGTADAAPAAREDTLVVVVPDGADDPFHVGPGPKSIVISGEDGEPIGAQG